MWHFRCKREASAFPYLADTIDGLWALNGEVWGRVAWRGRSERANGAGHEKLQLVLLSQLHNVVHPCQRLQYWLYRHEAAHNGHHTTLAVGAP